MKVIYLLFLALVFLIIIAFSILNSQDVTFYYFFGQVRLPLALPVVGSFVIGAVLGVLFTLVKCLFKKRG